MAFPHNDEHSNIRNETFWVALRNPEQLREGQELMSSNMYTIWC
jgi:hypothetical protein